MGRRKRRTGNKRSKQGVESAGNERPSAEPESLSVESDEVEAENRDTEPDASAEAETQKGQGAAGEVTFEDWVVSDEDTPLARRKASAVREEERAEAAGADRGDEPEAEDDAVISGERDTVLDPGVQPDAEEQGVPEKEAHDDPGHAVSDEEEQPEPEPEPETETEETSSHSPEPDDEKKVSSSFIVMGAMIAVIIVVIAGIVYFSRALNKRDAVIEGQHKALADEARKIELLKSKEAEQDKKIEALEITLDKKRQEDFKELSKRIKDLEEALSVTSQSNREEFETITRQLHFIVRGLHRVKRARFKSASNEPISEHPHAGSTSSAEKETKTP